MLDFIEDFFPRQVLYQTKIAYLGLGKLGMPCAEACARKGFDVTGYDTIEKRSDLVTIKSSIKDTGDWQAIL